MQAGGGPVESVAREVSNILVFILVLVLIAPLWGQDTQQDKCANLDPQKPVVCLSVPNDQLTVDRQSGSIGIYASFLASAAVAKPVRITITVGGPANASGVKLDEGDHSIVKTFEIDAAHALKDQFLRQVKTSSDNPTSGSLIFPLFLRSDDAVEVRGSPGVVTMVTQP